MNEIVLQWFEDFDFRDELLERLHKAFSRNDRTGIHISDLIHCLRKAWYNRQPEHKNILTDDSVLYFVRGRSLHDMIEKLFPKHEHIVKHDGIIGTIDAVDENACYEIKTTKELRDGKPRNGNILQLRYYMAMNNTQIGYLLYYEYFTNRLRVFKFFATKQQLADTLTELSQKKNLLEIALEHGTVGILPWANENWECWLCDHRQCERNRRKD